MALRYSKAGGVGQYFTPEGISEVNTKKCQHCGKMIDIPNMRKFHEHMDVCRVCMQAVCLECADKGCTPLMKKIEEAEERAYRDQQLRKMMGY